MPEINKSKDLFLFKFNYFFTLLLFLYKLWRQVEQVKLKLDDLDKITRK